MYCGHYYYGEMSIGRYIWAYLDYRDNRKYFPFKTKFHYKTTPFSELNSKKQLRCLKKLLNYCIKINYNDLHEVKEVFLERYGISTFGERNDIKWVLLKMSRTGQVELIPSDNVDKSNKLWEGAGNFKITKVNF